MSNLEQKNNRGISLVALILIILILILAAVGITLLIVNLTNNNQTNETNNLEMNGSSVSQNLINEQVNNQSNIKVISPNISIDGIEYNLLEMTLSDLELNGFHIDYDNAGLYIDESSNSMYQGYDGQHPELKLTEERKDAIYMMTPKEYYTTRFLVVKDGYAGFTDEFENLESYSPIVLSISNYSSDEPRNYKDCDIMGIELGYSGIPTETAQDMEYVLANYPNINLKGIELGCSEADIINILGEPDDRDNYLMEDELIELLYSGDQYIYFYLYNDKLYRMDINMKTSCFE